MCTFCEVSLPSGLHAAFWLTTLPTPRSTHDSFFPHKQTLRRQPSVYCVDSPLFTAWTVVEKRMQSGTGPWAWWDRLATQEV